MFFRIKSVGSHQYLQIVHSVREGKKVRQRVLGTLGRFDELKASGRLDALMRSGLPHCENFAVIDAHKAGETDPVSVRRIGPDLVFARLWKESGIPEALQSTLKDRRYELIAPILECGLQSFRDAALLPEPCEDQVRSNASHGNRVGFPGLMGVDDGEVLPVPQPGTHQSIQASAGLELIEAAQSA